jgi:glucose/arabinose dehydrogenase
LSTRLRSAAVAAVWLVLVLSGCTASSENQPATGATSTVPIAATTTTGVSTTTSAAPTSVATTAPSTTTTVPIGDVRVGLVEVDAGFDNPVLLVASPDGGSDLIVEQSGRIVRADGGAHELVLDISSEVSFGGEQGLLGLAVHPRFAANPLVYVNFTDRGGDTVIDQYELREGTIVTDTRQEIIRIEQPARNHNGGMLAFGPDGNLWIGMGDGGGSNDQFVNGQSSESLLGAMIRITVGEDPDTAYEIPPDNPFATGSGGRQEVWSTGLRNPWRFSFDGADVWIADVGQQRLEEINVADAAAPGLNYGWSVMEGTECFLANDCDVGTFVVPITEYNHSDGCSVTGGVVYRGIALPSLSGQFFYSDFCSGLLRSVSVAGDEHDWSEQVGEIARPTGFGTGSDGEMYIVTQGGTLLRLEAEN